MAVTNLSFSFVLAATTLMLFPHALAQGEAAGARAEPSFAEPADEVELIFTVASPDLLEVAVQERVVCVVIGPDGAEDPFCERAGSAVEVRAIGSATREYAFTFVAPGALGVYTVRFETQSTLRVLGPELTAETTFEVFPAGTLPNGGNGPGDPDGEPGLDGADGADGDAGGDGADGGNGDGPLPDLDHMSGNLDAARILVSSTVGLGVLALAFVGNRWPLLGGRS